MYSHSELLRPATLAPFTKFEEGSFPLPTRDTLRNLDVWRHFEGPEAVAGTAKLIKNSRFQFSQRHLGCRSDFLYQLGVLDRQLANALSGGREDARGNRGSPAAHSPRKSASGSGVAEARNGRRPLMSRRFCDAFV